MENPFVFGKAAEGAYFTDRKEDARRLTANLTHGINTILISPRRWGKTSLVKRVIRECDDPSVKFVFIDVFQCKSEFDFCRVFAREVIKQTSSVIEEWVAMAKGFLSNISPKFSFGSDPLNDFSVSFEWSPNGETADSILALPEKIAQKKGVRIVVCIDEFQQVADFQDSVSWQKQLRSSWQHQQHATYCLFGSKKHLMDSFFNDKSMPFYKFGDLMFLGKIPTAEWVGYICYQFARSGKSISTDLAQRICDLTENLSSYVQQLSWLVWYKTNREVTEQDIDAALADLLEQNKVFFQREIEQLTEFQLNFLRAVASGITTGLNCKGVIKKYNLESSANVQSIKKALLKKDLIYIENHEVNFDDPLLKLWLQNA